MITRNAPTPTSGAGKRNTHLLRALAETCRVTLLIVADDPSAELSTYTSMQASLEAVHVARIPGSRYKRAWQIASAILQRPSITLRFSPSQIGRIIRTLLAAEHFDVVVFQSVIVADHRLPPEILVVIDEHNIEYELMERSAKHASSFVRRMHYAVEAKTLKRLESRLLGRCDLTTVTSQRECDLVAAMSPVGRVVVIPNGVDIAEFSPNQQRNEIHGRIIFTGSMNYHPNEQAAHYFADSIWPLVLEEVPNATWHLVGAKPPASFKRLAGMTGVSVTGSVAEIQPHLHEASVAIAPLLVGAGTRLKILEALAMGKAVVTTSIGCEGLEVTSGEHLIVADTAREFANAVVELLHDEPMRTRLGEAGRELVVRSYDWVDIEHSFASAINRCVADRNTQC